MTHDNSIDAACRSSEVGKLTRSALYFHRLAFELIPENIRILVLQAEVRLANRRVFYRSANVIKVARDGSSVSFLWYPDFEMNPHPALMRSTHVPIGTSAPSSRNYMLSANPPVLHRKEEFVAPDHSRYKKFAALTRAEERVGLLTRTPGFQKQWRQRLAEAGFKIRGHRLRKI